MLQHPSLDRHRLGQIPWEVDVEALHDGQPVSDQLQGDDVEDALQDVDRLGNLDLLGLVGVELGVVGVANDDGLAAARDDCSR